MAAKIDHEKCLTCVGCVGVCPMNAMDWIGQKIVVDSESCTSCRTCEKFCPVGAISMEASD